MMIIRKKIYIPVILFFVMGLVQTCKKPQYNHKYVDIAAFFPYLSKGFEAQTLKFNNKDVRWSRYRLKGFRTFKDQLPRKWAIGKESTIIAYFTQLRDKTVRFHCRPFNPPGQPVQEGKIYINGAFLKKITFNKKGQYTFQIPANHLKYGSNQIVFKWKFVRSPKDFGLNGDKRKFVMGFFNLTFHENPSLAKKRKKKTRIHLKRDKKNNPVIRLPQAGIVEYFIPLPPLPAKTQLRFKLTSPEQHIENSVVHIAIYNQRGEQIVMHLNPSQFSSHQVNLKKFAGQTVKIVIANSIDNHPNFTLSLLNFSIYSSSEEGITSITGIKKSSGLSKNIKPYDIVKKPNVIIYLIDTLRADHMSCYGYRRKTTPFIDRFSKEGILIKKCFAVASWTKPTTGSILTGLYPNKHHGEDQKDKLSMKVDTLAEILKTHGYSTIHITPNLNSSKEVNFDQGVDHYLFSKGGTRVEYFYHSSEYVNSEFLEILKNNPELSEKPFFAFIHTVDPHDPYTPEEPFLKFKKNDAQREGLGLPDNIRIKRAATGLSPEDIDYMKSLYDCEILHNDFYFGKFLQLLKDRKLYDNSIVILVADHGEQFQEHGELFHGSSIYNEEIHVPLIFKFPNKEFKNMKIEKMVSQIDILPTILHYLGIEIPDNIDGMSILNDEQVDRSIYVKEKLNRGSKNGSNFVGIIRNDFQSKYIINYRRKNFTNILNIEAYNLIKDFTEKRDDFDSSNLFTFMSIKFLADYFLEKMESYGIEKSEELNLNKLDPEKLKQLKALGYIN